MHQWLDDMMFYHISNEANVKTLWEKLHDLYEKDCGEQSVSHTEACE